MNCYRSVFYDFIRQKLLKISYVRFLILSVITAILILSASGCSPQKSDPLAYRNTPITAEISGTITKKGQPPFEFSARLSLGQNTKKRPFTLCFLAPESISSITVSRNEDGKISLFYENMECPLAGESAIENVIKIAEMLNADERITDIYSIPGNEAGLSEYERLTSVMTEHLKIYIDPHTSYPVHIIYDDGSTEISYDTVTSSK